MTRKTLRQMLVGDSPPTMLTRETLTEALNTSAQHPALHIGTFKILDYLQAIAALPPEVFAARYAFPVALPPLNTPENWMQCCLLLTPPFQTTVPAQVRDTRYPTRRPAGYPCRAYPSLITLLTEACTTYATRARAWLRLPDIILTSLEPNVGELAAAEGLLQFLRTRERVPSALKGLHTKRVHAAFTLVSKVLDALCAEDRATLLPQVQRYQVGECYAQLLATMAKAFADYGPAKGYPKKAINHALSQILTPLLVVHPDLLDADCTTPFAIQRRLSRWRDVLAHTPGYRPLIDRLIPPPPTGEV